MLLAEDDRDEDNQTPSRVTADPTAKPVRAAALLLLLREGAMEYCTFYLAERKTMLLLVVLATSRESRGHSGKNEIGY